MSLVPAHDYTDDDLLNTLRVLPPLWFTLLETSHRWTNNTRAEHPEIEQALFEQQHILNRVADAFDLPHELVKVQLDGEHELSLGTSLMKKRKLADHRHQLEVAVDQSFTLWMRVASLVRSLRPPIPVTSGSVAGLFTSSGGVPKQPIDTAIVGQRGVQGDIQATRKHHGRPWQALCLWSGEVVDALAAEGHPIAPGAAGENISVRGFDWSCVSPGTRLTIGEVTAEITAFTLPCSKNARWFADGNFERIHHRAPGHRSRVYAHVLDTGTISVGDSVILS